LQKIAYDFEYDLESSPVDPHRYQGLVAAVEHWQGLHASADRPFLYYSKAIRHITVYDGRNPAAPVRRRYDGLAALVIEACNEAAKSETQIRTGLAGRVELSDEALATVLADLTSARVLYEEQGKYLTLAIPEHPYL